MADEQTLDPQPPEEHKVEEHKVEEQKPEAPKPEVPRPEAKAPEAPAEAPRADARRDGDDREASRELSRANQRRFGESDHRTIECFAPCCDPRYGRTPQHWSGWRLKSPTCLTKTSRASLVRLVPPTICEPLPRSALSSPLLAAW